MAALRAPVTVTAEAALALVDAGHGPDCMAFLGLNFHSSFILSHLFRQKAVDPRTKLDDLVLFGRSLGAVGDGLMKESWIAICGVSGNWWVGDICQASCFGTSNQKRLGTQVAAWFMFHASAADRPY